MENLKYKAGIYKIKNLINKKVYIGSSSNLYNRKRNHINELKKGRHHNLHLQKSVQKYGIKNFKFEIIEYINKNSCKDILRKSLIEREQYWIDYYSAYNKKFGYNISKIADSCYGIANYTNNGKPVINIDTGKKFKSTSEAKRFYGIKSCISDCCNGKAVTAGGYRWAYIKNNKIQYNLKESKSIRRKVINKNDGKNFKSIREAAKYYNIDSRRISEACRTNKKYNNSYWKYVEDIKYNKISSSNAKKVININTKETFNTIAEASLAYNCERSGISRSCSGKVIKACGFEWAYIVDGKIQYNNSLNRIRGKKIINLDTKEVFKRIIDASKKYNIASSTMSTHLSGKTKMAGGYHWQYYEDYLKEHPKSDIKEEK